MDLLQHLNNVNEKQNVTIYSIHDERFKTYGRIVSGYDFSAFFEYMETKTTLPDSGNVYVASVEEMEQTAVAMEVRNRIYGQMDIEIGYCNGKNSTFNGMEYHKGSEVNIAVTDFMLILGHIWDVKDNTYKVEDAEVFLVKKGEAIEMYQTTLHLSPCKVQDDGFKGVVILPKGSNTPLSILQQAPIESVERLLLQRNKWVIAHSEREPLIKQGAFPGIIGNNIELLF